jgi:hypothetical protein
MRFAAAALALAIALPAAAGEIVIPVVNRGPGAGGSVWRTSIVISNVSITQPLLPIPTTITLHRPAGDPISISMPLVPQETLDVEDALFQWFGLQEGGGIVRITWQAPGQLDAWARIYNVGSEAGEFGQGIPGITTDDLRMESHLTGLKGVGGSRTNVGVSNPHDVAAHFWVTLYDTSGASRGAFATAVPARSYVQFNDIFAHFQAGPLHAATIRISASEKPLFAYASIVRNDSGDPTFVQPR